MAQSSAMGVLVAETAWPEVDARLRKGATAILPVAAAAKQHGPHLPLATDCLQAEWLVERLLVTRDVVVWPTLGYGFYPAFTDYPGSISLSHDTFVAVVAQILEGISDSGAERIAILNAGISTIEPLTEALRRVSPPPLRLINIYAGARFAELEAALAEQPWGGHADELETSIMLAIAPQKVDMDRATAAMTHVEQGPFNRTNPDGLNYSPSGVNGDPTRASLEKGKQLLRAMLMDILEALDAAG
jgi:creatinine amidohydrolase